MDQKLLDRVNQALERVVANSQGAYKRPLTSEAIEVSVNMYLGALLSGEGEWQRARVFLQESEARELSDEQLEDRISELLGEEGERLY